MIILMKNQWEYRRDRMIVGFISKEWDEWIGLNWMDLIIFKAAVINTCVKFVRIFSLMIMMI